MLSNLPQNFLPFILMISRLLYWAFDKWPSFDKGDSKTVPWDNWASKQKTFIKIINNKNHNDIIKSYYGGRRQNSSTST